MSKNKKLAEKLCEVVERGMIRREDGDSSYTGEMLIADMTARIDEVHPEALDHICSECRRTCHCGTPLDCRHCPDREVEKLLEQIICKLIDNEDDPTISGSIPAEVWLRPMLQSAMRKGHGKEPEAPHDK